jgi:hypothetical protein
MKPFFSILFFLAAGLFVCLSYLLVQLIDLNAKSEYVILDVAGLFANIILINFLLRKYINQPSDKGPNER